MLVSKGTRDGAEGHRIARNQPQQIGIADSIDGGDRVAVVLLVSRSDATDDERGWGDGACGVVRRNGIVPQHIGGCTVRHGVAGIRTQCAQASAQNVLAQERLTQVSDVVARHQTTDQHRLVRVGCAVVHLGV